MIIALQLVEKDWINTHMGEVLLLILLHLPYITTQNYVSLNLTSTFAV